jgi:GNAT superfamily N-acetyltransferase
VVTDHARMAWLSDVFVLQAYRGRGLGKWLVQTVMDDPRLATVRRWMLATDDAHGLYRQLGWQDAPPDRYMTMQRP